MAKGMIRTASDASHGSCANMAIAQADGGQHVATDRRDQQVERAAGRLGDEGLAGDEFGGVARVVEADVHRQHLVENARLDFGDDVIGDFRQHHLLAIGGETLGGIDRHDRAADRPHGLDAAVDEDPVDDVLHDPRRQGRGGGDHPHHGESDGIALGVFAALVAQQALDQRHLSRAEPFLAQSVHNKRKQRPNLSAVVSREACLFRPHGTPASLKPAIKAAFQPPRQRTTRRGPRPKRPAHLL